MRLDPAGEDLPDASGLRIAVATATFNESVTSGLKAGALDWLRSAGAVHVTEADVAGAFELPLVAGALTADHDGVVALGAVIEGETDHYDHVAHRASEGLMRVMLNTGVPVSFGILTVRDPAHAIDRSMPGPRNKGAEAAAAAVETALLLKEIRRG